MRRRHAALAAAVVAVGTSATSVATQRTAELRKPAEVRAVDPYPVDETRLLQRASRAQQQHRRALRLARIRAAARRRLHALAVLHAAQAHARELAHLASGDVPAIWQALARCESSGNWHDTAGQYEGGVQFLNSTWLAYGGGRFAEHAYDATPMEQVIVARRVLAADGPSQWPVCSRRVGLTRENGR